MSLNVLRKSDVSNKIVLEKCILLSKKQYHVIFFVILARAFLAFCEFCKNILKVLLENTHTDF